MKSGQLKIIPVNARLLLTSEQASKYRHALSFIKTDSASGKKLYLVLSPIKVEAASEIEITAEGQTEVAQKPGKPVKHVAEK